METRLKHLSQKFSALDDVGIMDDESDWDGEYFPSGYRSEDLYGSMTVDLFYETALTVSRTILRREYGRQ